MRLTRLRLLAMATALAAAVPTSAYGDAGTHSKLTAIAGQGAGFVEVAPTAHDVVAPDTFNVQGTVNVHTAAADTTFTVLRRVDPVNPDGDCSTAGGWMTLPPPNSPTLTTSKGGAGALHFEISRPAPVDGQSFDVQWRLEGSDGSILESECFTVTVK
jgi:hypothetical protein